jgi:hypothetical protein
MDIDPERPIYTESNPPVRKPEPKDTKKDQQWDPELEADRLSDAEVILSQIPPGFVHDMVAATRGVESPTEFCLWSGLFAVSSALQRRAWIWPAPYQLYPNLFLVYMAPPAINKKSTTVRLATKVLRGVVKLFEDPGDREIFSIPIHDGAVTPEGMFDLLKPRTAMVYEENSIEPIEVHIGSRLALIVDELASFLGKQKYNTGQITRMINLYDCKDHDSNYTIKGNLKTMEHVFFNFFAATTPSGFEASIPEEAHGGGFLSRIILVRQDRPTRYFPVPFIPEGAPSIEELARRLAWVARFKGGEYVLNEEAQEMYEKWYHDYRNSFRAGGLNDGDEGNGRGDVMLMKIATLIRAQSYTLGTTITPRELKVAILLVGMIEEAKKSAYGLIQPNEWSKRMQTIVTRLESHPDGVPRTKLSRWVSRALNVKDMDEVLDALVTAGKLEVYLDDQLIAKPHRVGKEIYVWKG